MNQPMISTAMIRAPTMKYRVLFDDPPGRLAAIADSFPTKVSLPRT